MSDSVWEQFHFTSQDGLRLAGRKYGWSNRNGLPVVCLPGLTRNARDFHDLAVHLSTPAGGERRVLVLEYRGRGRSEYDRNWENYNVLVEAGDVVDAMAAADVGHAAMIGTSRGGLIMMALSAMRPGIFAAAVLNDVGPEINGPGLVRIKTYVERGGEPANWQEASEMMRQIGQRDFTAFGPADWDRLARQIFREENGRLVRDYDKGLATLMKSLDLNQPLPQLWPQFDGLAKVPMMVIRGANSDLLTPDILERMKARRADMKVVEVEGQGHAPDLGTAGLPQKIARFLADAAKGAGGH